jgi:hypothetical protein
MLQVVSCWLEHMFEICLVQPSKMECRSKAVFIVAACRSDQHSHRLHVDEGDCILLDFLTPSTFAAITGSTAKSERIIVRRWQGSRCWEVWMRQKRSLKRLL